jgi:prepilin-type N-terminal cleavage/methylation domain-containing protein
MKKNSAFTLIELSVVLILIGILIAGVAKSGTLIRAARLSAARSLTLKSTVPSIPGLIAWYETSLKDSLKTSETTDGAQITTWYDISPDSLVEKKNTMSKTAAAGVVYKLSGINNLPSLSFADIAGTRLKVNNFYQGITNTPIVFMVFQPFSVAGTPALFGAVTNIYWPELHITSSNQFHISGTYTVWSNTGTNPPNISINTKHMVVAYLNGSASKIYFDNAINMVGGATLNYGTGYGAVSNQVDGMTIGSNQFNTERFTGYISEVIIYNRALNLSERKDVMKYLSKKYGIAVVGIE